MRAPRARRLHFVQRHAFVAGSHTGFSAEHGFAAPQFFGGPPLHIVAQSLFGTGDGWPTIEKHPHVHGSSQTEHSASLAQGPASGIIALVVFAPPAVATAAASDVGLGVPDDRSREHAKAASARTATKTNRAAPHTRTFMPASYRRRRSRSLRAPRERHEVHRDAGLLRLRDDVLERSGRRIERARDARHRRAELLL